MSLPPLVAPKGPLSGPEVTRTARHARLAELGEVGQQRLAAAHVAIIGAGGLGSPVVMALAAAGIGTLTVIDDDTVDLSNLQRQILHRHSDVGSAKVDSAVRVAADLSPTRIIPVAARLTAVNGMNLLSGVDVVVDGTDTFDSREVIAEVCERAGKPLVWGAAQEFAGQVTVFWSTPPHPAVPTRLSDLYPPGTQAPSCADVGVLGALCVQVGGLMSAEVIKLIAGVGEPLLGRLAIIDALRGTQRQVPLRPARGGAPSTPETVVDVADARVIDVRTDEEIAVTGMIDGAAHIPLDQVLANPASVGPGPVVIVCESGARAARAAEVVAAAGVRASVLAGGMRAWMKAHA